MSKWTDALLRLETASAHLGETVRRCTAAQDAYLQADSVLYPLEMRAENIDGPLPAGLAAELEAAQKLVDEAVAELDAANAAYETAAARHREAEECFANL